MLESKKYNIIEWIISLADEKVIDAIQSLKERIETSPLPKGKKSKSNFSSSTYKEIKDRRVDVEQLKKDQKVKFISSKELKDLAVDAGIEESIDKLLIDLKNLG